MVIFDVNGKKILKCEFQLELNAVDKKIARVLTARNELHQAIAELFTTDCANVDGWTAKQFPDASLKATAD